jgi:FkbM family methyltransferase
MSLSTSLTALKETVNENRQFRQMGAGSYDLLRLHYQGRLEDRLRLRPKNTSFRFRHFGRWVDLQISAPYLGAFKGVFLDREYDCTNLLKTPPKRILDLGANIGMGTISLACQFPDAEFICVEPDPRNVELLKHNLNRNKIEATIIVAAVAPEEGTAKLRFNENPTCSRLESLSEQDLKQLTNTKLVSIPAIKKSLDWKSIELLKIDIEGAEEDLLREENSWLTDTKSIILEIHPNTTAERISSYLNPFGFTLSKIPQMREPVFFATRSQAF